MADIDPKQGSGSTGPAPDVPARLLDRLREARSVAVLTGAGMSAESGVPTFRGTGDSLWQRFDPLEMASADAFRRDPPLVWGWYLWRMALVRAARPHAGHRALAALRQRFQRFALVTQNVDDLHERAGSEEVVHLHGSLFAARCSDCAAPAHVDIPPTTATAPELRVEPPRCAACGGAVRPGVVWFGEILPAVAWERAADAVQASDVVLVVGTSGLVQPAASLPSLARRSGAFVAELNPRASGLAVDLQWPIGAAIGLPTLREALDAR